MLKETKFIKSLITHLLIFLWHNGEKIVQDALSFCHILERHMCFELRWSVTQLLRNNCDRELAR